MWESYLKSNMALVLTYHYWLVSLNCSSLIAIVIPIWIMDYGSLRSRPSHLQLS